MSEKKIDFNNSDEFSQLWNDMTRKLQKGREAFEYPSTCYILRNEEYKIGYVYTVISKYLPKNAPKLCRVMDNRKVSVKAVSHESIVFSSHEKGQNVSPSYYWDTTKAKSLEKVVEESGFSDVSAWLDNWKKTKSNFEFNKEHEIWLIKVLYPHTNIGITIKNDASKLIPKEEE